MKIIAAASMVLATLSVPAMAQHAAHSGHEQGQKQGMAGMDHSKMEMMMKPTPANPYPPAEMEMHQKMMSAAGADATETWVRKMIEHHRGAIAMSKIVLRDSKDQKVRQMAEKTIAEQEREISDLQAWLREQGKTAQ